MVDSRVKGLKVIDLYTDETYIVYALISNSNSDTDYFLVYNDRLRREKAGFSYLKVENCMPVSETGLTESIPL